MSHLRSEHSTNPAAQSTNQEGGETCRLLEESEIWASHRDCGRVQGMFIRCAGIRQVHGAVRGTLAHCRGSVFEMETNSAVDNPLVFVKNPKVMDGEGDVLSGGNFHWRKAAGVRVRPPGDRFERAGWGIQLEWWLARMVNPVLSEAMVCLFFLWGTGSGHELGLYDAAGDRGGTGEPEAECWGRILRWSIRSLRRGHKEDYAS